MRALAIIVGAYALLLAGCAQSDSKEIMFGVRVAMSAEITSALADGEPQRLEPFGTGWLMSYERRYISYSDAIESQPVRFDFRVGEEIRHHGSSLPGWCGQLCIYPNCPSPDELSHETLELTLIGRTTDFSTSDFECLECAGEDKYSRSCQ